MLIHRVLFFNYSVHSFKNFFLVFLIFAFYSCSNSEKNQSATSSDSQLTEKSTPLPTAMMGVDSRLDILFQETANLESLFSVPPGPPIKKWVLKLSLSDGNLNDFTLSIWPEKNQRYQINPVFLNNGKDTLDLGDTSTIVGDQKLNSDQVGLIRARMPSNRYIIFVPQIAVKSYGSFRYNTLYYDIYLTNEGPDAFLKNTDKQIMKTAFVTSSNPSPPASSQETTDLNQ